MQWLYACSIVLLCTELVTWQVRQHNSVLCYGRRHWKRQKHNFLWNNIDNKGWPVIFESLLLGYLALKLLSLQRSRANNWHLLLNSLLLFSDSTLSQLWHFATTVELFMNFCNNKVSRQLQDNYSNSVTSRFLGKVFQSWLCSGIHTPIHNHNYYNAFKCPLFHNICLIRWKKRKLLTGTSEI